MTDIAIRHDGFTPERTALFLEQLARRGNVRLACAAIGLSRESAYRLRRRDPLFARGWAAALVLATQVAAETLADRALEGVEEEVWFRGEVVGTRRRYDNRLLLAHLGRLDRLGADATATADAQRFDEVLACLAGAALPDGLARPAGDLPPSRAAYQDRAREAELDRQAEEDDDHGGRPGWEQREDSDRKVAIARTAAGTAWDGWQAAARTHVDGLLATARTVSDVSTSAPSSGGASVAPVAGNTAGTPRRLTTQLLASTVSPVSPSPLFAPAPIG